MSLRRARILAGSTGIATLLGMGAVAVPAAHAAPSPAAISPSCQIATIGYGDTGALVKAWQWRLHSRWVALNSTFDPATLTMTKYFQTTHGLPATGVVDPTTWSAIGSYPGCSSVSAASLVTRYVTAHDTRANIRTAPSYSAAIIGSYPGRSQVTGVLAGDWLQTSRGYVNQGTLTTTSDPSDTNGRIALSSMCEVPLAWNAAHSFDPGYTKSAQRYLNCYALVGLNQLQNAYRAKFGSWAAIDLTYRSFAEQQYWYKLLGFPQAAVPGTSNHGYGQAVDFEEGDATNPVSPFDWGRPGNTWLQANSERYGFVNPFSYGTFGESYHHSFVG